MAKLKEVELICVTGNNNNKYYKMKENSDGTFTAKYGRVGGTETVKTFPMREWDKKYKQKLKKRKDYQYKDVSHLRSTSKGGKFSKEKCSKSQKLLDQLQNFSGKSVSSNYTISSDAVTQIQIDHAQDLIDDLAGLIIPRKREKLSLSLIGDVNDICTDLYTTIPRKMKKVQDYLLDSKIQNTKTFAQEIIATEQNLLDVMAQQVSLSQAKNSTIQQAMSQAMGIDLELVTKAEETKIKKLMGKNANNFKKAYKLINTSTQNRFEKRVKKSYKDSCDLFWHGSRNENWLNIIKTGLLIRPSGVVLTGAMYGNGIYFADKAQKSIGYTSMCGSYWARGNNSTGFLALYEVNTGLRLKKRSHEYWMQSLDYKKLRARGKYDSFFAEGGTSLRNNEFIVYDKDQCTIKYLVEIG